MLCSREYYDVDSRAPERTLLPALPLVSPPKKKQKTSDEMKKIALQGGGCKVVPGFALSRGGRRVLL